MSETDESNIRIKGFNLPASVSKETDGWRLRRWHAWLLVAGLLIRIAYGITVSKEDSFGGWDGKEYYAFGQSILAHNWDHYARYFIGIRPPFYPLFLTPFLAINDHIVWHIQVAQSLLGVVQAVILARVAGRWAGIRAGNWAFVIALFHPFLIYYTGFVLTETLFITLLWAGIACLQNLDGWDNAKENRWLVSGAIFLGLACLTRPALQPFLAVSALWIGWQISRRNGFGVAFKRVACFTAIVSLLLLPWMIGNYREHGDFSLSPGAAQSMYDFSNSPEYLSMYRARTKDEYYEIFGRLVNRFSTLSDIPQETSTEEARAFRQNQSSEWWTLQWYKLRHFWTPWLNPLIFSRANFLISLATITPLFFMAVVEIFRRRTNVDSFLVLLLSLVFVGYLIGGFLFQVQIRYRFPFVDVTCMILSASLLGGLIPENLLGFTRAKLFRQTELVERVPVS